MSYRALIEKWVDLFNAGDARSISELYAERAVNHQVALEPVVGRAAIEQMFRAEFDAYEMVCIVENIFVDGNVAILEWRDPKGLRGCGFFWIEEGKIVNQRGYWDRLSMMNQQSN